MDGPARSGEQAGVTDLTELDGAPSWRADVLFDRQKVETAATTIFGITLWTARPTTEAAGTAWRLAVAKVPAIAIGPILRRLTHRH
jgi:hypothetical protein